MTTKSNPINYKKKALFFLLLFAISFLLSLRNLYSKDIGFHLKMGQWITENFSFISDNTFSPNEAFQYIDLNWLYQVINYCVYTIGQETLIILFNSCLVGLVFIVMLKRHLWVEDNLSNTSVSFLILSIFAVYPIYEVRPHTFSWLYLALLIHFLNRYSSDSKKRYIICISAIMLLWVNTHSLFILGCLTISIYIISSLLSLPRNKKKQIACLFIPLVVCLFNPYFIDGFLYPFRQALLLQGDNVFNSSISELEATLSFKGYIFNGKLQLLQPLVFVHLFLLFSLLIYLRCFKKFALREHLILLFFFVVGLSAVKNIGYMVVAVAPILSASIVKQRLCILKPTTSRSRLATIGLPILLLIIVISISTNFLHAIQRSSFSFGLKKDESSLPYQATDFVKGRDIKCEVLNSLNVGGHLLFHSDLSPYIDGRLEVYGERFYQHYLSLFKRGNEKNTFNLLDKKKIDMVIADHQHNTSWILALKKNDSWRPVFYDGVCCIYLRNGFRDDIINPMGNSKERSDSTFSFVRSVNRLTTSYYYPAYESSIARFYYLNDFLFEAQEWSQWALQAASLDYPELYFNAGTYFYKGGQKRLSTIYYQEFLKRGYHPIAEDRINK